MEFGLALAACGDEPLAIEGQFGRPLGLAQDDIDAPRLAFVDEGCRAPEAVGGCPEGDERVCASLLIDTLAPLSYLLDPRIADGDAEFDVECLELRPAAGVNGITEPDPAAAALSVVRLRFPELPLARIAATSTAWTNAVGTAEPGGGRRAVGGVLGGNALRDFAWVLRRELTGAFTLTPYRDFPGTEAELADQGRAYLPVQFPGGLVGARPNDVCEVAGVPCELDGFDLQRGRRPSALEPSKMVLDACVGVPPCALLYEPGAGDDTASCRLAPGASFAPPITTSANAVGDEACKADQDPGEPATLVVATSVPGLVLFSDSAERMFGSLDALPFCQAEAVGTRAACRIPRTGELYVPGWPEAVGLTRLRVRSVALVQGSTNTSALGPCARVDRRRLGLLAQCSAYATAKTNAAGDVSQLAPPYSGPEPVPAVSSEVATATFGEAFFADGRVAPDPERWVDTLVLPADHPLTIAVRRDVVPDARQPDGLVGSLLFDDAETVLDYTDPNPNVRVKCLSPTEGDCLALPLCREDLTAACCFGLPTNLLLEFIGEPLSDPLCCRALAADQLAELQARGSCVGVDPP
jgi:hypothetical protein